jgi:hypothetical protein
MFIQESWRLILFNRPFGTLNAYGPFIPGVKTPGYFQMSFQDKWHPGCPEGTSEKAYVRLSFQDKMRFLLSGTDDL